jgi:dipeptidyl-peptidase-3
VRFITTAIHELLGHGTGKLLSETSPGVYNFDNQDPPKNPLSGKPVTSYYLPGQTWGSVFGKLAGTVEECRAILMSEYLMDNEDLGYLRVYWS